MTTTEAKAYLKDELQEAQRAIKVYTRGYWQVSESLRRRLDVALIRRRADRDAALELLTELNLQGEY